MLLHGTHHGPGILVIVETSPSECDHGAIEQCASKSPGQSMKITVAQRIYLGELLRYLWRLFKQLKLWLALC